MGMNYVYALHIEGCYLCLIGCVVILVGEKIKKIYILKNLFWPCKVVERRFCYLVAIPMLVFFGFC